MTELGIENRIQCRIGIQVNNTLTAVYNVSLQRFHLRAKLQKHRCLKTC